MTPTPTLTPTDLVTDLLDNLSKDVEGAVQWGRLAIPMIKLLWRRMRHLARRYASIMARFDAGTLPAPGTERSRPAPANPAPAPAAAPAPPPPPPSPASQAPPPLLMPRHIGWITRHITATLIRPYELAEALAEPELAARVAAAPQLGSVLRPLCDMLAVTVPPWLRLPRRPRRPRPSRAVKHPPPPDWLVNEPGAILKPDNTVWMRLGASTLWKPGGGIGRTLEEAQKFDYPRRIWPR